MTQPLPDPPEAAAAALERASRAVELRRWPEAKELVLKALGLAPSVKGFGLLAQAELALKAPAGALSASERGLALEPGSEWLLRLRALSLRALKRGEESVETARRAVAAAPSWGDCHHVLGQCLAAMGRLEEAILANARAISLSPENPGYLAYHGQLVLAKGCRGGSRVVDDGVRTYGNLSPAAAKEAEVYFRRSLALDPAQAETLNMLGLVLRQQGKRQEALDAYAASIRLDPTRAHVKRNVLLAASPRAVVSLGALAAVAALAARAASIESGPGREGAVFLFLLVLAVLSVVLGALVLRRRRRLHPQHQELLEKIEADKKAGRI